MIAQQRAINKQIDRDIDDFCDTVGRLALIKVISESQQVITMQHAYYDIPVIEYDDRNIKHWLDNADYYGLDSIDRFLLRHNRDVQMFAHVRPQEIKLTPNDLLQSASLYNWIESNLTVPLTNAVSKRNKFWIASMDGAQIYLAQAKTLLTWDGREPTEEILDVAEWFLLLQIAPVELLKGYYYIPPDVWMSLYSRAAILQREMVEGLLSNLMQTVAMCQYTDIGDGREVHPDVIRNYCTFKETADPLQERRLTEEYAPRPCYIRGEIAEMDVECESYFAAIR